MCFMDRSGIGLRRSNCFELKCSKTGNRILYLHPNWKSLKDMKKIYLLILISLLGFSKLYSQADTAFGGIYITNIYDLDIKGQSVCVDFWVWMNTRDSSDFDGRIEIPGTKEIQYSNYYTEETGGYFWTSQKYKVELYLDWNIKNYPFDSQVLQFRLEDTDGDTSEMVYVADTLNSKLDSSIKFSEWNIKSFRVYSSVIRYNTTYGDPLLSGESFYTAIVVEIVLDRIDPWMAFIKMLTGVYVAFLISVIVFFIKPINVDPRFGLCVGGLFASVGNKYVVESSLPTAATNTLIDYIHNITFLALLIIISISVLSLYLYEKGGEHQKWSSKIDRYSFWIIFVSYLVLNYFMISSAVH